MTDQKQPHSEKKHDSVYAFIHDMDRSALYTIIGIILLFLTSIIVVLIAPQYIDANWTSPSSPYQVQMYEIEDPNLYLSNASSNGTDLMYVRHLKDGFSLLSFKESDHLRILAPKDLEKFITRADDKKLKLTSKLLILRDPEGAIKEKAQQLLDSFQPQTEGQAKKEIARYQILELYDPQQKEMFTYEPSGGIIQNWIDKNYVILDEQVQQPFHADPGVTYAQNPREFKITTVRFADIERWQYDANGKPVQDLKTLTSKTMGFHSRKELIQYGEHIYAIEGCWYCHTDQTRTLIQDVVLNGSDSYPAPPSSSNEYIYQKITFAGTRRIGPDISRVGIKRPSRDWHKAHFWSPKTASAGSIMPSFRHFFDNDPRGTSVNKMGIPNYEFEAVYQYLMTKGTRITPPTQAWWLGKDPIKTKEIIEGRRKL